MSRGEIIKFLILRSIGNFLVLFAIFGIFATFGPALAAETRFRVSQARGVRYQVADSHLGEVKRHLPGEQRRHLEGEKVGGGFAEVLTGPKEQILIPKDTNFSILIPKIGASAKVIPNVDPVNEEVFLPVLREGVAHARGTVFPGMKGNIYLFAHSVDTFWNVGRYNAVFYLLKDLEKEDDVVVIFEGRRHNYIVFDSKIVDAEDISYLTKSHPSAGHSTLRDEPSGSDSKSSGQGETLVLQSCWPPGTTWKRLIVLARPK